MRSGGRRLPPRAEDCLSASSHGKRLRRGFLTMTSNEAVRRRMFIVAPWGERAGGAEQMLWTLLRRLDPLRVDLEVGFLSPGAFVDEVSEFGVRAWSLPASRLRDPVGYIRTIRYLVRRLRSCQPDVAIAWSAKAHLYLGVASAISGRSGRTVWWQHNITTGHWVDRVRHGPARRRRGLLVTSLCEEAQSRV